MTNIEKWKLCLREEHRIKLNCDYAVVLKYSKLRVLCQEVYEDTIRETAAEHGVEIASLHTFSFSFVRNQTAPAS